MSMGRATCPLLWAAALGAAQACGVSRTTRGIAPASFFNFLIFFYHFFKKKNEKARKKNLGGGERETTTNGTRAPHTARTPVNRRHLGQDTAHAQAPRTTKRRDTTGGHTGEQEPNGPGHRTHKAAHRADTPVNRSQVAQDTPHTTQHTEQAQR